MRQPDFSLKTRNVLIGLGACTALLLGSAPTYAQMTIPTDKGESSGLVNAQAGSKILNSGTLIGTTSENAEPSLLADNPNSNMQARLISPTNSNSAIGSSDANAAIGNATNTANPDNTSSKLNPNGPNASKGQGSANTQSAREEYTGSMIKPTRPQIHLYQPNKEATPSQPMSTSLVDVAGTTPHSPLTIVVYFAAPEQVQNQDIDSLTGASVVVRKDEQQSITGYMADYIGQKLDSPIYKLQPASAYPQDHDALIEQSIADSKLIDAKNFELKVSLEPELDLSQVERIFIGFPLWWNDLPLPIYAFLQNNDLSGKTIIPFCTYGNNAPYQLFNIFKELEPNAKIQRGLALDKHRLVRNTVHKKVDRWLEDIK